ncbi:hypothetical protein LNQ49_22160 [Flavobacterium sp. F-65]|jgi:hypothetical protein|uniref:Tissue inhibitor of metalloproteinase n=1 Tax=Flavobacterium pisciphilum TaxID=2893755 RepID=A0ABS8MZT7_9FLAO|nr:hypothetical protein [Flavobacterium sp. F-65]MCC9074301.1 hypothetical protein [Flavobacterium sp. F-65]
MKYLIFIFIACFFGCTGKKEPNCFIEGIVYFENKPIANIEFGVMEMIDPIHSSNDRIGITNNDGKFKLMINSGEKGTVVYFKHNDEINDTKMYKCSGNKLDTIYLKTTKEILAK